MFDLSIKKHPFHAQVKEKGLRQWQLVKLLGGKPNECRLSRMLNGIDPMPESLEKRIKDILEEVQG